MKKPPRQVADYRFVVEIPLLEDEIEYALVELNPYTQIVTCFRCQRETCDHARDVRAWLREQGEYD